MTDLWDEVIFWTMIVPAGVAMAAVVGLFVLFALPVILPVHAYRWFRSRHDG